MASRIYVDLVGLSDGGARDQLTDALKERGKPEESPALPVPPPRQPATTHSVDHKAD